MKKVLIVALLLGSFFTGCSKTLPGPGKQEKEPREQLPYSHTISILYPNVTDTDNFRTLSEKEIETKAGELAKSIFAPDNKSLVRSLSREDFSRYVHTRIAADTRSQALVAELESNGVYVMAGSPDDTVKSSTRYGDASHIVLARRGLVPILNKFLQDSEDGTSLDSILGVGSQGAEFNGVAYHGQDGFAVNVMLEDYVDHVFLLHQPFEIHGTSITIDDPEILGGITTITHFWDPEKGWNGGNKNIWEVLKKMIKEYGLGGYENDIAALLRPEYKAALLKNPPSAFYKALCLWYGWKTIEWRERDFIDSYAEIHSEKLNRGIMEHLRYGDKAKATQYLAHVTHLLMDMSVPAHVHNDPHGGFGGADIWEGGVVKDVLRDIIPNESYRFSVLGNSVSNFYRYSYKDTQAGSQWESVPQDPNKMTFYQMTKYYYDRFSNTFGLWPLFFNTAKATQFFPTYKDDKEIEKRGINTNTSGNPNWLLSGAKGFSGEAYNNNPLLSIKEGKMITGEKDDKEQTILSLPATSNGTYYLVYNNNGVGDFWKELMLGTVSGYIKDGNAYVYLGYDWQSYNEYSGCYGEVQTYKDPNGMKALGMANSYCTGCVAVSFPAVPDPMGYNTCMGPTHYLVIPPGGMAKPFEDVSGKPQIKVPTSTRDVLYTEGELEQRHIHFTLEDLVKCLKYKGMLNENQGVQDLVEFTPEGKIGLRRFPGKIYERIYKSDLDALGIYILPDGTNPVGMVLYLTDDKTYADGHFEYDDKVIGSKLKLYFIESPFDKMSEYLLPLTIATTTRLVRNYYRFYY